jgi:cyclopentanol dehydrogenase
MAGRFDGKVAIVSGGARGIGAAEVRLLAADGARVVVGDLLDQLGEALLRELPPGCACYLHLDATSKSDWQRAVDIAETSFGRLDILINNAGVSGRFGLEETSEEEWHRVVESNLTTAWLGMLACIPAFRRAGGGAVVNTSSIYGIVGSGKATAYHAAKGGVLMLTKAAATEYAAANIRVNSVHPGLIDTPMTHDMPPGWKARLTEATPMKRMGKPEEVARAALFLASDDASYVTGATLLVDGGYTAV